MKNQLLSRLCMVMLVAGALVWGCKKEQVMDGPPVLSDSTAKLSSKTAALNQNTSRVRGPLPYYKTFTETDFVSAGVGGLRDVGVGTINLPNSFSYQSIKTALLYWHGYSNSTSATGQQINVNSSRITGVRIGLSFGYGYANTQAYRADITELLRSSAGRAIKLSEFGDLNPNGASIIIFYDDGNSSNNRDVVIFNGNDANTDFAGIPGIPEAPRDPSDWSVILEGVNYFQGNAFLQLHVSDGDSSTDGEIIVWPASIFRGPDIFSGTTVPGGRWDILDVEVNSALFPGLNNLELFSRYESDFLNLIVALYDLPARIALRKEPIPVGFDIKPDECPNNFICSEKGLVSVALLGSDSVDVTTIDLKSIRINGVAPESSTIEYSSSPISGKAVDCRTCGRELPDGLRDLVLKFDIQKVGKTLGNVKLNQCVKLNITGRKITSTGSLPISGTDFITIKNPK
ncbi:hypothetical protein ACTHQF_01005 [Pedobacter sp. SAFR-022]|uniref:hypothetical protein n=1 Tax=Pedobacter sp. SAFR-022 TaxID=3436861 RepID=UPI003F7D0E4D